MSEDEAAHAYDVLRSDLEESWPISEEERAAVERGLADARAGRLFDQEEVERELGLI
jgi:predicted transcriptional regulator